MRFDVFAFGSTQEPPVHVETTDDLDDARHIAESERDAGLSVRVVVVDRETVRDTAPSISWRGVVVWEWEGDACAHSWEEQPGEPPVDVCTRCGATRR